MRKSVKHLEAAAFIAIVFALTLTGCSLKTGQKVLTPDEIKTKAESFINDNLMTGENKAQVTSVEDDGALYKVKVKVSEGQEIDSFMTKDGTKFFPQVMDLAEVAKQNADQGGQEQAADQQKQAEAPKKDKPVVELFVMSHCPYGTQIEKGIIPVVEALGNKIDFSLKFCDYAMHQDKEVNEQLLQTCISKEQSGKLLTYLKCYLKAGDSAPCIKEAKIDKAKADSCVAKIDKEFSVTKSLKDKSTWVSGQFPLFAVYAKDNEKYGIKGSPALVVNGQEIQSSRDSASLLKTICTGFNKQPAECAKTLSSEAPAPGFGEGTTANSSGGGCAN